MHSLLLATGKRRTPVQEDRGSGVVCRDDGVRRDAQFFSIGGPIGSLRSVITGQLRAISALRAV